MKIASFIGTFKKEDGVTRVLLELTKNFEAKGYQNIIITGWSEDPSITSVPIVQVPSIPFPFYREYRLAIPGTRGFAAQLSEFQPDIIHLHSPDTIAWAGLHYAKDRHIPIIATYHTNFIKYLSYYHANFLKPAIWRLFRKLYTQMDAVTAPSEVIARELIEHGITKTQSLPWGVDFERFNPKFRSQDWRNKILGSEKKVILISACRLTWEKDLKTLAEAHRLLKKQRNDFAMVIAGDGPQKEDLKKLMPEAIFLGHLDGGELSKVYASSDILLFPSSTETFGNNTIEGMAAGLIPVVADAGGSMELVENGKTGFLCQAKNPRDFFEKTNLLLDDAVLREKIRQAIPEFVKSFSWDNVADKVLDIYRGVIDKK